MVTNRMNQYGITGQTKKTKGLKLCNLRPFVLNCVLTCRGGRIRTYDLHIPNVARYRATLHPELPVLKDCKSMFFYIISAKYFYFFYSRNFKHTQRRERDSNPRYGCPYDSLANCSFRPLRHLSLFWNANIAIQSTPQK